MWKYIQWSIRILWGILNNFNFIRDRYLLSTKLKLFRDNVSFVVVIKSCVHSHGALFVSMNIEHKHVLKLFSFTIALEIFIMLKLTDFI